VTFVYSCVTLKANYTLKNVAMPPQVKKITKEDNYFQRAEALKRSRDKRNVYREFLVEGVSQINLAIANGWAIRVFIYSQKSKLSDWARDILKVSKAELHLEMSLDLLARLSQRDEPSELLAIVKMPDRGPEAVQAPKDGLVLVFDRPGSPGNLGTSLRSADAFGVDSVFITGHAVDIYDPQVLRASMGALFCLPVVTTPSHEGVQEWLAAQRQAGIKYNVIGTSATADTSIATHSFSGPTVLILGNEAVGMSRSYREMCDTIVSIPIAGSLSSINVSCAASIVLYEIRRQQANPL